MTTFLCNNLVWSNLLGEQMDFGEVPVQSMMCKALETKLSAF